MEPPFDVALLGVAACLALGDVMCAGLWEGLAGLADEAEFGCVVGLRGLLAP